MNPKHLRSQQHDEFAVLNYYAKVSKYDLDRSNINMAKAKREKQFRREVNARAKKTIIETEKKSQRFHEVVEKVKKVRELSVIRKHQNDDRRIAALEHQERLREYI